MIYMKVFIPRLNHTTLTRHRKGKMQGKGGSVLLSTGGPGAGSSYDSVSEYVATTGRPDLVSGRGASLNKKLASLSLAVRQPKPRSKNIKFNL